MRLLYYTYQHKLIIIVVTPLRDKTIDLHTNKIKNKVKFLERLV